VAQREREAREEAGDYESTEGQTVVVKVPIRVGQIIRAYEQKATKGDVQAGRELRSWLADYPPEDDELRLEDMPHVLRQRLLARLIAEIEAEDAANEGNA
jgi:hypothetical protein